MGKKYMRYHLVDSHRSWNAGTREKMAEFYREVKNLSIEQAAEQVAFCDWYEREFAVKWFEIVVKNGADVVGYLRCLRNPDIKEEWFVGDIHVLQEYRNKGIATRMYEKVFDTLSEFEAAEYVLASVHCQNYKSIGLHEKMGFENQKIPCTFPNFYFDEKETVFRKWLYQFFPVRDLEKTVEQLLPFWAESGEKHTEKSLREVLVDTLERKTYEFETIWCGNRLVGFVYYNDQEENCYIREF